MDTNFAISHLSIVIGLVDRYDSGKALVLVPWVVIQELDGLKNASSTYGQANLSTLARNAVKFIHDCLSKHKIGLRGQKLGECIERHQTGDDAILDCARYWHEKQHVRVVLLSNDRNLCSKMLIHGLEAVTYELGLTANKILSDYRLLDDRSSPGAVDPPLQEDLAPDSHKGPAEMQTDPVLPPYATRNVLKEDAFAALSAKAGIGRYEQSARARILPISKPKMIPERDMREKPFFKSRRGSAGSRSSNSSRNPSPQASRCYSPEMIMEID